MKKNVIVLKMTLMTKREIGHKYNLVDTLTSNKNRFMLVF